MPLHPSQPLAPSSPRRRSLRSTASTSALNSSQPTLADLVDYERRQLDQHTDEERQQARRETRQRRRSSAPLPGQAAEGGQGQRGEVREQRVDDHDAPSQPPDLDRLLPPHYGRPSRPSSPDVLAALLRPVLQSLSRSSTPAASPLAPSSPVESPISHTPPLSRDSPASQHPLLPSISADTSPAPTADRSSTSLPAHFPPRAPTDPAPTVESQGFVLYIGSAVAYAAYLVWAFVPGEWLERAGIAWYPSQEWALLVPAWVVMLVAFTYSSYFFLNLYNTPPLTSLELLAGDPSTASKAFIPPPPRPLLPSGLLGPSPLFFHSAGLADSGFDEDAIPPLYDLPQEWVERVLYGGSGSEGEARQ